MREGIRSDKTYINVVIPIINTQALSKSWAEIKQTLFGSKEDDASTVISSDDFNREIEALLEECKAIVENETRDLPHIDDESSNAQGPIESLFGEDWQGGIYNTQDEEEQRTVFSANSLDEYGKDIQLSGVINSEAFDSENGLLNFKEGKVRIFYDHESGNLLINGKTEYGDFRITQNAQSVIANGIQAIKVDSLDSTETKRVTIQVNTFIAAKVLEFFGRWEGDGRSFGETGSSRTTQIVILEFKDGTPTIVQENKITGMTHKLNKTGEVIKTAQADGKSLKAILKVEYSNTYGQNMVYINFKGGESNPIAIPESIGKLVPELGIDYEFELEFDSNGELFSINYKHDSYPSQEVLRKGSYNAEIIYKYSEENSKYGAYGLLPIIEKVKGRMQF